MQAASRKNAGFSLTEVLLAVGTLAVGMVFVAGVFPAAILLNTQAAERTIAATVADEAFAKVRIIAANPNWRIRAGEFEVNQLQDFELLTNGIRLGGGGTAIDPDEFVYPSADIPRTSRQYYWSAVCRAAGVSRVQVTIFVCRRTGADRIEPATVQVNDPGGQPGELRIVGDPTLVNPGSMIVDDYTGRLYHVWERDQADGSIIRLNRNWQGILPGQVWVIPHTPGGGRNPCIAVYQKVIEF